MPIINIISDNEHYDDILRQLPGTGYPGWQFTLNATTPSDVLVVLEYPKNDIEVSCIPSNTFLWSMEPPDEEWEWLRKCYRHFSKIITIDNQLQHPKIYHNQLAIPWQIQYTFDELNNIQVFQYKNKNLSFITSNYKARKGHKKRLKFLNQVTGKLPFDLYGRGFKKLDNKADGLMPYKYTIVVENSRYKDYWSEKLADAFLCGCLPIYYGCPNVSDYFSENAYISIDINKPEAAIATILKTISGNEWEKRKDAIITARQKILNEYQFFPQLISVLRKAGISDAQREKIFIPKLSHHPSVINPLSFSRNYYLLKKLINRRRYLDPESPNFGFTTYK